MGANASSHATAGAGERAMEIAPRTLDVQALRVDLRGPGVRVPIVDSVTFSVAPGETVAIVGESGSGKTLTAMSVLRLIERESLMTGASTITLNGRELKNLSDRKFTGILGKEVGVVFQDHLAALNPVMRVGDQVREAIELHTKKPSRKSARETVIDLFRMVGMANPEHRYKQYPHQLSGGLRQRTMLAMAIANRPQLLVLDEPTTALDATIQAQVLDLIKDVQSRLQLAVLIVTHDMGVVAEIAHRALVMYAGRIVESTSVNELFGEPEHPYTRALIHARPLGDQPRRQLVQIQGSAPHPAARPAGCAFHPRCPIGQHEARCKTEVPALRRIRPGVDVSCHFAPGAVTLTDTDQATDEGGRERGTPGPIVVQSRNLSMSYRVPGIGRRSVLRAVEGVDITIRAGQTVGLVGESGCGKTTLARLLTLSLRPTDGEVECFGTLMSSRHQPGPAARRKIQMVYQDPGSSLDPRQPVLNALIEAMKGKDRNSNAKTARALELLDMVGLRREDARKRPHEFSGGQRQRIVIARALSADPEVLVLDEPVSALDVSVQAQVINVLQEVQERLGLGYLFISHDLSVVRRIADDVAVMYLGRVVESGPVESVLAKPQHPYTYALTSAAPVAFPWDRDRPRRRLQGEIPSAIDQPSGCPFRTRCWKATEICVTQRPALAPRAVAGHLVACHHPGLTENDVAGATS